jgi:ubiquinone/menaquinone biosynthesis C-methylase UbiE
MGVSVTWDYSELAATYDRRADYSDDAIAFLLEKAGVTAGETVADIGAGTGKMTTKLVGRGLNVHAVEPNDAMRSFGEKNTEGKSARWTVGTGEATGLEDGTYPLVTFGSSFNVTDRPRAMAEACRILNGKGSMACLWNHRNLDNPLQKEVEQAIHSVIPSYGYGTRREDQGPVLRDSGLFSNIEYGQFPFVVSVDVDDYVEAWRSHATLARQAGDRFVEVVSAIETLVKAHGSAIEVPYHTVIWVAAQATQ